MRRWPRVWEPEGCATLAWSLGPRGLCDGLKSGNQRRINCRTGRTSDNQIIVNANILNLAKIKNAILNYSNTIYHNSAIY